MVSLDNFLSHKEADILVNVASTDGTQWARSQVRVLVIIMIPVNLIEVNPIPGSATFPFAVCDHCTPPSD